MTVSAISSIKKHGGYEVVGTLSYSLGSRVSESHSNGYLVSGSPELLEYFGINPVESMYGLTGLYEPKNTYVCTSAKSITSIGKESSTYYESNNFAYNVLLTRQEVVDAIVSSTEGVSHPPEYPIYLPEFRITRQLVGLTFNILRLRFYLDPIGVLNGDYPCYRDLVEGYGLDLRRIPRYPTITPLSDKIIQLEYYQNNRLERIYGLKSICWRKYECNLKAGIPYTLPIYDCVLGTLYCDDDSVISDLIALGNLSTFYAWKDLLPNAIPTLFAAWKIVYDATNDNPLGMPLLPQAVVLHKLAANNNIWNNNDLSSNLDIKPDPTHPMFVVDNKRAYDWHIKPQVEGIGDLVMDSARTIEIHAALEAGKYGFNEIDPKKPRIANLGHFIERIAALLAYRPLADGSFKKEDEKKLVKTVITSKEVLDPTKIGVNNFASDGMVMRRLNNSFDGDKITSDQCVIVHDILQVMAEYQDQQNLALGLQESSAIQIKDKDETARYGNQLALMLELLNLAKSTHAMARSALISSLVAQAQSSETIAALGLPTVTKTIPIQTDGKIEHLPYTGVSPHRSISQEIATCTNNVGIVLGQLL